MNTDRNPTNPPALAVCTRQVLSSRVRTLFTVKQAQDELPVGADRAAALLEEALDNLTQSLLDTLLERGVLTPAEHGGAFVEDLDDDALTVAVRVEGLGWLLVHEDGSTQVVDED